LEVDEVYLQDWVSKGYAGEMAYMTRDPQRRGRPREILPSAKSAIVLALNYYSVAKEESVSALQSGDQIHGRISRYAWGEDYHRVFEERLKLLEDSLRSEWGEGVETRWYVDYGPVLEKAMAQRAGIGFIGKNTLLITEEFGSWVFLAVLLTNLEIESDRPEINHCGTCRLCLDACPTGALVGPFQLDARRCISYLTIELKSAIDAALRPKIGEWLFGCDLCQEVCPYNQQPVETREEAFHPSAGVGPLLPLSGLFSIRTTSNFKRRFDRLPLLRSKRKGLLRNAAVVLENHGGAEALSRARAVLDQETEPLVREHLDWARS
jgi:epoxyqueuosine reductase